MTKSERAWFAVYEFVERKRSLLGVTSWPAAGTPEWYGLDDDDPAKLAAVLEAGEHWVLRIDTAQQELGQASRDISVMENWKTQARRILTQHSRIERRRAS